MKFPDLALRWREEERSLPNGWRVCSFAFGAVALPMLHSIGRPPVIS